MEYTLSNRLVEWYGEYRRELPWRETEDPYFIWLSEVILQQTRVAQGLEYFYRFRELYPTVVALADASEDEVLKNWQGLGYYSRARNLLSAARHIATHFGGVFPREYADIRALKGVGDYTAAAISSFAYGDPYAVVDGNVYRVLSRLFAIELPIDSTQGKKEFARLAQEILNPRQAAQHNQAMMELGSLQCVPISPNCGACPLQEHCLAYAKGEVARLPVKSKKSEVKPRYFNYLQICSQGKMLLQQRTERDIWRNLYEFPLIETSESLTFEELERTDSFRELFAGAEGVVLRKGVEMPKHLLSHRVIYARFYRFEVERLSPRMEAYLRIDELDLEQYAISRLMENYLEGKEG